MKIDRKNPQHWLLLVQQLIYTLVAAACRPFRSKTTRPLVVLYGHQLSGNLNALYQQWLSTHSNSLDLYFLSLDPEYSAKLRAEGVPVLQCNRLMDMLTVGRCDAIITDHGLHLMSPLLTLTDIRFIDVWHGIPFKGFVPQDFKLQHRYNEVWVSSPLLKTIYVQQFGFSEDKVVPCGYARSDKLFSGQSPEKSYRGKARIAESKTLVLYAPTWQQDNKGHALFPFNESQESFIKSVSEACERCNAVLVIRSHLNAKIAETQFTNVYYCSMKDFPDTEELLQETDILICDWSSIAFDYLALKRPALFLDVPCPYKNGFSLGPEYRYGEVVDSMPALVQTLESALSSPESFLASREDQYQWTIMQVYGNNASGEAAREQMNRLNADLAIR